MIEEDNYFAANSRQIIALLTLVILGIVLTVLGVIDWRYLYNVALAYTDYWWLVVVLIAVQAVLYTFALPGSLLVWVVAPLYEPLVAASILVVGSTLGGLFAYLFSGRAALSWIAQIQQTKLFLLLRKHGDFLTLCALRAMPYFPQSIVSYGSGILRLPLISFVLATVIGFSIKSYLYCIAIHGAVNVDDPSDLIQMDTLLPLIVIVVLFIVAGFVRARWRRLQ